MGLMLFLQSIQCIEWPGSIINVLALVFTHGNKPLRGLLYNFGHLLCKYFRDSTTLLISSMLYLERNCHQSLCTNTAFCLNFLKISLSNVVMLCHG